MQSRIVKCKECGEQFDTEAGGMYGYQDGEFTCPPCWEAEEDDGEPIPDLVPIEGDDPEEVIGVEAKW